MWKNQAMFDDLRGKTVPQLLVEHARNKPEQIAFRSKHLGLYRERTWSNYAELVGQCAIGLRSLGLERSQRVAIMGDACEEWMVCDLAAQALGCITFGIYSDRIDVGARISDERWRRDNFHC